MADEIKPERRHLTMQPGPRVGDWSLCDISGEVLVDMTTLLNDALRGALLATGLSTTTLNEMAQSRERVGVYSRMLAQIMESKTDGR